MKILTYLKSLYTKIKIGKEKQKSKANIMETLDMMNYVTQSMVCSVRTSNYDDIERIIEQYKQHLEPLKEALCYQVNLFSGYGKLEEALCR